MPHTKAFRIRDEDAFQSSEFNSQPKPKCDIHRIQITMPLHLQKVRSRVQVSTSSHDIHKEKKRRRKIICGFMHKNLVCVGQYGFGIGVKHFEQINDNPHICHI